MRSRKFQVETRKTVRAKDHGQSDDERPLPFLRRRISDFYDSLDKKNTRRLRRSAPRLADWKTLRLWIEALVRHQYSDHQD